MNRELSADVKEVITDQLMGHVLQGFNTDALPEGVVYRGVARSGLATFQIKIVVEDGLWKYFEVQVRERR